ncbi:hypothetical protein KPL70_017963 [Citrus sinensis]|nr:hypothetical protein KPL70_017963 [Citrus sinensis]
MRILLLSWLFLIPFLATAFGIDVVLVSGQCQSDQQLLLLQTKNSLVFHSSLSVNLVEWRQGTDCCDWGGVDCDGDGRVIGLDLSNESISGGIENATGLFSLQHLRRLNLAYNSFNGSQIPSRLASLTNLTYLNLSNAGFVGQIPIQVSRMTRLVTLDLSSLYRFRAPMKLENPNLSRLLQNLTELRELSLDGVNISAPGIEWCQALSSLVPKLRVLSLSSCYLSGPIHPSLAKLQSLSVIRLDQNDLLSPVPGFLADFFNLTSLRLSSSGLNGTFPEKILQVHTLEALDLSGNSLLQGSLPDFPKNSSLRTLMLSNTNFSGVLPDSIGNLKNLSRLDLALCYFSGSIPTSLADLTQLVYLDLSFNQFVGPIPSLHMSKNLTHLDLSYNALPGAISSTDWEHLSNLVYVDLSYNSLNGSIPGSLFSLPILQQLHLANNKFGGLIPKFSNASSSALDTIDLSSNRLEGPIPMSIFELKNLKILILSSNKLNGTVQVDAIQMLRNLTRLELSYNNLTVNASSDSSFPSHVSKLRLASCKMKVIPNLKSQSKLFNLDLSDNQISGEIPNWVWEIGNGGLEYLNLSHNLLSSLQRPFSISDLSLITVLDLRSNQLQGNVPYPPPSAVLVDYSNNNFTSSIPDDIGTSMNFTIFFSLSNNYITGVIPETLCRAKNLLVLDLSKNKLGGKMPTCLIEMSEILGVLNLRGNRLSGTLSVTFPGNCALQTLDLNGNQLGGKVPKSLASCTKLEVLDLGNNKINDTFPCWLKNISSLRVLVLRSNSFYGNITCRENDKSWPKLQIVDLASNNFGGRVPQKCITTWKAMMSDEDEAQSNFKHLHFEFLRLDNRYYQDVVTVTSKGLEMELVKILSIFTSIDFSRNNFDGPIPEEIGRFKSLYGLNLSQNALTGPIPSAIGNLQQLESLDLSMNHLSGQIPIQLANLTFLSFLNLSHNNLVGKIPVSTQLQSFSPTSFEGNEGLCGLPLNNCRSSILCGFPATNDCKTNSSKLQPSEPASNKEFNWQFILTGVGFGVGSAAIVAPLMFSKKANKLYDVQIDKLLLVTLPMLGLTYKTSYERSLEAEENLEDELTDDDDDDDDEEQGEMETEGVRGRYCVFCSKLNITRKKVIHDPKCTCHNSPTASSSSSTSTSSSSLAHFDNS